MLRRIDLRGSTADPRGLLPRTPLDVATALTQVRPVVEAVREHGLAAVREATRRFDGVDLADPRVPAQALAEAERGLDAGVRAALAECVRRVRAVHAGQRRAEARTDVVPGGRVTLRWLPVGRVGLYVPGGLAVYPSTVVMNVVPAQVAGVGSLAVASPPQPDQGGRPDRRVLAACALLGVEEVYAAGGAQAIALVVEALQLVRLPYHLSALAQAAARAALAHADALLGTVTATKAQRDRIVTALRGLGLDVPPSDANFVLFGRLTDQRAAWRALLDRGVLVRDVGLPGWLRVTAGTPAETGAFLAALREVLGGGAVGGGAAGGEVG